MNSSLQFILLFATSSVLLLREVRSVTDVPIVETSYGLVRGVFEENEDGEHFFYMGIPYAKVPPDNVFGEAINVTAWEGIYEANDDSRVCPQREEFNNTLTGDLDCLRLNVYTPAIRSTEEPLAVFFWVHGGGFKYGGGGTYQWAPQRLTANEVLVVTVNYRVGVFGHLCLDVPEVTQNAALKDIIHALRWVNENIGDFGGDKNRITIGGSSSGSFSVDWISLSPLANGLYNRLILQSGTVTSVSHSGSDSKVYVKELAILTGYDGEPSMEDAWKYLTKVDPLEVVLATETLGLSFYFCAETPLQDAERVATEQAIDTIEKRTFNHVDTLLGFNSHERLAAMAIRTKNLDESDNTYFIDALYNMIFKDEAEKNETINLLRRFYIGTKEISDDLKYPIINLHGDHTFIYPTVRSALIRSEQSEVYLYMFSYDGNHNFVKKRNNVTLPGASHADEISYVFRQDQMWEELGIGYNETDEFVSKRTAKMWTNFVKYGDPTPEVSELTPVKWLPITMAKQNYMNIDTELSLRLDPYPERMAFWEMLYENYYHTRK